MAFFFAIRYRARPKVLRELIHLLTNDLYQLQIPHLKVFLKSSPTIYLECKLLHERRWNFYYKKATMMPATVNFNRLATYMPNLNAGSTYSLTGFVVTRCNQNYCEILCLTNTDTQLPDIIGEITGVKSTITNPPQDKNHVMAAIKMNNELSFTMSLSDGQAVKLHNQLESNVR
ncbi:hypothetical protein Bca101_065624 [Brassica carinata]